MNNCRNCANANVVSTPRAQAGLDGMLHVLTCREGHETTEAGCGTTDFLAMDSNMKPYVAVYKVQK